MQQGLFGCTVQRIYKDEHGKAAVNSPIARRTELWWNAGDVRFCRVDTGTALC